MRPFSPMDTEHIVAYLFDGVKTAGTGAHGEGDVYINDIPTSVKSTVRGRCTISVASERRIMRHGGRHWYLALVFCEAHNSIVILYQCNIKVLSPHDTPPHSYSFTYPPPFTWTKKAGGLQINGEHIYTVLLPNNRVGDAIVIEEEDEWPSL